MMGCSNPFDGVVVFGAYALFCVATINLTNGQVGREYVE